MKILKRNKQKVLEFERLFISTDLVNVISQIDRYLKTNQIKDYRIRITTKRLKIQMEHNKCQVHARLIYRKPLEKI